MAIDPKETTERKSDHRLGDLGFTRIPSEEDTRRNPELLELQLDEPAVGAELDAVTLDLLRHSRRHLGALDHGEDVVEHHGVLELECRQPG